MPKKKSKKGNGRSGDEWRVEVVAYDGLTLAPNGNLSGPLKPAEIDKLLSTLAIFADSAGEKLNDLEICPSELTVAGNVSLDVGGGVLLFGVTAGISVSMTWRFEDSWTRSLPRTGKRPLEPEPPRTPEG